MVQTLPIYWLGSDGIIYVDDGLGIRALSRIAGGTTHTVHLDQPAFVEEYVSQPKKAKAQYQAMSDWKNKRKR